MSKYDVILKPELHNLSLRHQRRTEPLPWVICTKKRVEDRTCRSGDRIADRQTHTHRQTDRHAHHNTPLPYRGRRNENCGLGVVFAAGLSARADGACVQPPVREGEDGSTAEPCSAADGAAQQTLRRARRRWRRHRLRRRPRRRQQRCGECDVTCAVGLRLAVE